MKNTAARRIKALAFATPLILSLTACEGKDPTADAPPNAASAEATNQTDDGQDPPAKPDDALKEDQFRVQLSLAGPEIETPVSFDALLTEGGFTIMAFGGVVVIGKPMITAQDSDALIDVFTLETSGKEPGRYRADFNINIENIRVKGKTDSGFSFQPTDGQEMELTRDGNLYTISFDGQAYITQGPGPKPNHDLKFKLQFVLE